MEFEKINLEKSWNLVSDLILCESNFSLPVPIVHAIVHFIVLQCTIDLSKISLHPVINQYMD